MSASNQAKGNLLRKANKASRILTLSLMLTLLCGNIASASWLSYWSGVASGASAGFFAGVVTAPIALVGGAAQLLGLAGDALLSANGIPPQVQQPAVAALPEPAAYVAGFGAFVNHTYPTISLPGTVEDGVVSAFNVAANQLNTLTSDVNAGAPPSQLQADASAMGVAIENMAVQIDLLNIVGTISQTDIDNFLTTVASTGLPNLERNYLLSAGWNQSDIDGLAAYLGGLDLNLAVPTLSLSFSEPFHGMASSLATPEPATLLLLGPCLAGVLRYGRRRRRYAAFDFQPLAGR